MSGEDDLNKGGQGGQDEGGEQGNVSLTSEQYQAMLEHMAKLEDAVTRSTKVHSIDDLADEGRGKKGPSDGGGTPPEDIDFDKLTPQQTMGVLIQAIKSNLIDPLYAELETIKVGNQIDKCAAKYEDFWEYGEIIKKQCIDNPTLSVEQSYKLAKAEHPTKAKPKGGEGEGLHKVGILHTLPKVPRSGGQPSGERPNNLGTVAGTALPKTRREAAEQAWDEVVEGKKK